MRSNKLPRPLREFLLEHKISTRLVFDARGFSKPERVSRMKARGKLYFVNGPKHSRCGLCLKDRSGHCVMCHPEAIKHQRDYAKPGHVYVARSPSSKLVKVGVAPGGREGRERSLNATRYGNCSDWKMSFDEYVASTGGVEAAIHRALKPYFVNDLWYRKGRRRVKAREVFRCSVQRAVAQARKICVAGGHFSLG